MGKVRREALFAGDDAQNVGIHEAVSQRWCNRSRPGGVRQLIPGGVSGICALEFLCGPNRGYRQVLLGGKELSQDASCFDRGLYPPRIPVSRQHPGNQLDISQDLSSQFSDGYMRVRQRYVRDRVECQHPLGPSGRSIYLYLWFVREPDSGIKTTGQWPLFQLDCRRSRKLEYG